MKLKKLVVQGFKSFKDKTNIFFDEGITGIVGPNGCGKSNIVDALFWIMGEQSAKHLRGSSMKDVIFSGSSKYAPANYAECSLFIENDDGKHIHIGNKVVCPSEIQLTRKLYRNGETEYKINGTQCRLRDIQEVFMDTGAGAKSYSIIAQGEINRLVQSKPEERRVIIEEVAGITKFKLRKKESLKKMEATEQNLSRLNDLKVEIERNLGSLRKQSEKAEKARSLKEKIKRDEIIVDAHKVHDLLKNYRDFKVQINEATINLEAWKTEKNNLELDLEEERTLKDLQVRKIEEIQSEYNELSRELAQMEERLVNLCKGQETKEKMLDEKKSELTQIVEEKESRESRLDEIKTRKEELISSNEEECDLSELEDEVEMLKEQVQEKKTEHHELSSKISETKNEINDNKNEQFKLSNRLTELSAQLEDITKEMETLEEQYSIIGKDLSSERKEASDKEELYESLRDNLEELNENITTIGAEKKQKEQELKTSEREYLQLETRLQSLKKISESMEGVSGSTGALLKSERGEGYSLLGSDINCDEKYTKAVSSALSFFGETLFGESAESAALWQKDNPKKRVNISLRDSSSDTDNISSETFERLEVYGLTNPVCLSDVIEATDEVKSILSGIYIVESQDELAITRIPSEINIQGLITLDGKAGRFKLLGADQFIFGADIGGAGSGVELNNQIKNLEVELVNSQEKFEASRISHEEIEEKYNDLIIQKEELSSQAQSAKEEFITLKTKLESKLSGFETNRSRVEILKNRKSQISTQRFEFIEKEEKISISLETQEEDLLALEDQYGQVEDTLGDMEYQFNEKRDFLNGKLSERKSFSSQIQSFDDQIKDVDEQLTRLASRYSQTQMWIENTTTEFEENETEISELEKSNLDRSQVLEEKTDFLSAQRDELEQLVTKMSDREERVKKLSKDINDADRNSVEKSVKLEQIKVDEEQLTRNIFEKYQVDLRHALCDFLELSEVDTEGLIDLENMYFMEGENGPIKIQVEEYKFNRRFGNDLKDVSQRLRSQKASFNSLGEINWQAIEDYDRQKLRFDFLVEQEVELRASLEDLTTAIEKIDHKSKERFKHAFEEVNAKFTQVFPIIFGGGEARLELKGTLEDVDAGVDIIAKPPGKKMQNINLMSGGEKAMTAVSLIFSVFLVKPSPFCLLDEVDAPLDDANVGRFSELLKEMSKDSQFILITHNKKTMELNDTLYGVTMQEPGVSKALSVQLQ